MNISRSKSASPMQIILIASYILVTVSLLIAFAVGIISKNTEVVLSSAATLVIEAILPLLRKYARISLPAGLELSAVIFLFCSVTLAKALDFYTLIPCWDILLHIASGPLLTALGVALLGLWSFGGKRNEVLSPLFVVLFGLFFSMTVASLWEFYEFAYDLLFKTQMQRHEIVKGVLDTGLFDTMTDMLVAFAGSLIYGVYLFLRLRFGACLDSFVFRKTSK